MNGFGMLVRTVAKVNHDVLVTLLRTQDRHHLREYVAYLADYGLIQPCLCLVRLYPELSLSHFSVLLSLHPGHHLHLLLQPRHLLPHPTAFLALPLVPLAQLIPLPVCLLISGHHGVATAAGAAAVAIVELEASDLGLCKGERLRTIQAL